MSDWGRTQELMNVVANSAGTGVRQMALSLDSIETKINKLKATWQEFTYNFLTADMAKDVLDFLNDALTFVTSIVNTLNTLPAGLGNIILVITALGLKSLITMALNYGKTFFATFKEAFDAARAVQIPKDIAEESKKGAIDGTAYGAAYAKAVQAAKQEGEVADVAKKAAKAGLEAGQTAGMAAKTSTATTSGALLGAKAGAGILGKIVTGISSAIPYVLVAAVVVATITTIVKAIRDNQAKIAEAAGKAVDEAITKVNEKTDEAKSAVKNYTDALELQRKGILRTAEETEKYQSLLETLRSTSENFVNVLSDDTLELNTQADTLQKYNEKLEQQIKLQQQIIAANQKGAVTKGVMASQTGLDTQESFKNLGSTLSKKSDEELASLFGLKKGQIKGAEFDKLAQGGMGFEAFADIMGKAYSIDYSSDEYYKILENYINGKGTDVTDLSGTRTFMQAISPFGYDNESKKMQETYQIMDKFEELLGEGTFKKLFDEQHRLSETYAQQWTNFYANVTGGKVSSNLVSGIANMYSDATSDQVQTIVKDYYNKLSVTQQEEINKYIDTIGTEQTISVNQEPEKVLAMYGIPPESDFAKALSTSIEAAYKERDKQIDLYSKKYVDLTGKDFDKENYSKLTMQQLNQLMSNIATVSEKYGQVAASQFENSYKAYTDQIGWDEDLVFQFAGIDLTNVSDISDYAALMATRFGETNAEYTKFIDLVNNSSNILDRTFQKYAQYIGDAKKEIQDLDGSFDDLSSAAEGKLKIADAFSLMEKAGDALDLSDFYATANGYGLTQEKIKKVQEVLIEQKKISYQLDLAQYQLKMEALQAQVAEVKGLENINLAKYAQLTLDKAIRGLNADEQDYYTQTTNSLREQGKLTEALDYIDAYRVSNTIPKIVDLMDKMTVNLGDQVSKAKKMRDVLKDFIEWLKKLDKYAAVDSFMEQLDFDIKGYDFNIEFSTNADEIADSIEGKINAINQLVNANLAKSDYAEKSAEGFRKTLEQDWGKYVSFDVTGNLIENADEFTAWGERIKALESENSVNQNLIDNENQRREVLDDLISQYREERKIMRETEQTAKDYVKQLKELNTQQLENIKNVEDKLLKLLEERDQKVIDNLKERYDYMKEQDQEYLDSVKEAVDKERKLRDQSQDYEDLNRQERKLQLLKMSGGSATEIQNLEQEIAKSRQNLADQEIDNLLDELSQEQELKQKKMDEEVEYLQAVQDAKLATMTQYNIEVKNIMSQGKTEIMNIFKAYDQEYITGTETARALWEQNIEQAIASAQAAMQTQANPAIESVQNRVDELTQSQDLSKSSFETYANTVANMKGSLVSNIGEITDTYLHQFKQIEVLTGAYHDLAKAQGSVSNTATSRGVKAGFTSGFGSASGEKRAEEYESRFNETYSFKNDAKFGLHTEKIYSEATGVGSGMRNLTNSVTWKNAIVKKVSSNLLTDPQGNSQRLYYIENMPGFGGVGPTNGYVWESDLAERFGSDVVEKLRKTKLEKFAKGGLVDYTGPAWVDGTKSSPEAFLSAKDTANISALTDILSRTFSMAKFTAAQSPQNNGDTYYQIHINVDELGDGYTVDDLVSEVEDKILSITGRNSVIQVK